MLLPLPWTSSPPESPFLPVPVCLSGPATAWLCSASSPFPPTPLWMSTVGGLLHVFWGEGGGLSLAGPTPPPPWRSFSFFCRRSYVLLVLSSRWPNGTRLCWVWESAETERCTQQHLRLLNIKGTRLRAEIWKWQSLTDGVDCITRMWD